MYTVNKRDIHRLEAAQMKFLRYSYFSGFMTLDRKRNTNIRERLHAKNIIEDIGKYKEK
jgi:hypothetical protein